MNISQITHTLKSMRDALADADLEQLSGALAMVPKNDFAYTYTITGFDKSPYITRTLLPRSMGHRPLLHRLHREDADEHMHNHPWETAYFIILRGGYTEERLVDNHTAGPIQVSERSLRVGDVNQLNRNDYHRVSIVQPGTWTLGLVGERVQNWGFLVDGRLMPHQDYFAMKGHHIGASEGKS